MDIVPALVETQKRHTDLTLDDDNDLVDDDLDDDDEDDDDDNDCKSRICQALATCHTLF